MSTTLASQPPAIPPVPEGQPHRSRVRVTVWVVASILVLAGLGYFALRSYATTTLVKPPSFICALAGREKVNDGTCRTRAIDAATSCIQNSDCSTGSCLPTGRFGSYRVERPFGQLLKDMSPFVVEEPTVNSQGQIVGSCYSYSDFETTRCLPTLIRPLLRTELNAVSEINNQTRDTLFNTTLCDFQ